MIDPLLGPKLKIKRAYEHIEDIRGIIERTFSDNVYALVIEEEQQTRDRLVKIKFIGSISDNLYTLIAETAYHLRSALDQLAVALANASGVTNTKHIYFPFAGNITEFNSQQTRRKINGINSSVVDIILDLRPYKGGNDFLWGLARLSNIDKHNYLIPIGSIVNISVIQNLHIRNAKVGLIVSGPGRLDEGIVISNLGLHGTIESKDNSEPNFKVSGTIAFGNIDIFDNKPVLNTLNDLTRLVEEIIKTFEPYC